jgi:pimeloyl-ACP methyl ester carboxylesterase
MKSLPFRALVTLASVDQISFSRDEEAVLERDGRLLVPNRRTGQLMPVGMAALRDLQAHRDEYDLDAAARMLNRPWLILHGSQDESVPVFCARHLFSLAPAGSAKIVILDGADHTLGTGHPFTGPTPDYQRMVDATVAFLRSSLR